MAGVENVEGDFLGVRSVGHTDWSGFVLNSRLWSAVGKCDWDWLVERNWRQVVVEGKGWIHETIVGTGVNKDFL